MTGKQTHQFDLVVGGVKYFVVAQAFSFNEQVRYTISINGLEPDVFVWNEQAQMFQPIGDGATILPDALLVTINDKLQSLAG